MWVCLGSGFRCAPSLLAGVLGPVCGCVCVLAPLVPRHAWLGCAVWVCVLALGFRLRPATPGWGVGVCVFVCALRLYPATPGWGVWCGCVCLGSDLGYAPAILAGFVVCGFGVALHLSLCRGSLRIVRTARVCGTRWLSLLGTCPCALVVAGGVPFWRVWWPHFCAPRLVRSGRSRCSGRLSRRCGAFPHPEGLRPRLYWVAARGTRWPAENQAHFACRWPPPWLGRWARSASYKFGASRWGCPWRVPPASVLGCVCCGGWCVDRVTDACGFPYRPSFNGGLSRCTAPVSFGRRHRPIWVGGRQRPGPVRVCVCVSSSAESGGLAFLGALWRSTSAPGYVPRHASPRTCRPLGDRGRGWGKPAVPAALLRWGSL